MPPPSDALASVFCAGMFALVITALWMHVAFTALAVWRAALAQRERMTRAEQDALKRDQERMQREVAVDTRLREVQKRLLAAEGRVIAAERQRDPMRTTEWKPGS